MRSSILGAGLAVFVIASSPTQADDVDILRSEVANIVGSITGSVGASIAFLGEDPIDLMNGDKRFPFMSTVKPLVVVEALKQVEKGELSLDQQIEILPTDLTVMTPIFMTFPRGSSSTTLYNIMWTAIVDSDNTAPGVLMRIMDGPKGTEAFWNERGITNLSIDHNIRDLLILAYGFDNSAEVEALMADEDKKPGGMWAFFQRPLDPNPLADGSIDAIPPNEMVRIWSMVLSGEVLDAERTDVFVSIAEQTRTGPHRLKGMLPPETVVGHKTGTGHNYIHDTGFIRLPDGRVLVIAVYTDSPDASELREKVIAQIARSAYDWALYARGE